MADALSRLEIIDDIDYNLSDTQNLDTFYADLFDLSDDEIINPITGAKRFVVLFVTKIK